MNTSSKELLCKGPALSSAKGVEGSEASVALDSIECYDTVRTGPIVARAARPIHADCAAFYRSFCSDPSGP